MVRENADGTLTFKNGVTAKLVNGEYQLVQSSFKQDGGRVAMPSNYFGNINSFYQDIPTNNEVVNPNSELPNGELAREAIPKTMEGHQEGGAEGHKLDFIYNIFTKKNVSLFSEEGKNLLKKYIVMSQKTDGSYY